jgi:hypothetical protein
MRTNLHYVLTLFSAIDENGFRDFLMRFLNLEYSFYDYKFEGFDAKTGTFQTVRKIERKGKNQDNNTKRYVRIAFESLQEYKGKKNRKIGVWKNSVIDNRVALMLDFLKEKNYTKAERELREILILLAAHLTREWANYKAA